MSAYAVCTRKPTAEGHDTDLTNISLVQHTITGNSNNYCYLIIRNAEASLVEIESRDRQYKRILLLLRAHGCNMNVNSVFFSRNIVPQIPTPEKWNKIKMLCY